METVPAAQVESTGVHSKPGRLAQLRRMFAIRTCDLGTLFSLVISNWFRHNVPRLAASLAFYTMLSLAPLVVIVVAVAGLVFGREAAQGQLVWQIQDLVGRAGAEVIQTLIKGAQRPHAGTIATILGVLTLFYGASSVVAELRSALNTIWCVPYREEMGMRGLVSTLRDRTLAFGLVLGIGFLLVVSLAFNAVLSAIGDRIHQYFATPEWLLQAADFLVSWIVIAVLFAILFKYLPDLHIEWTDVVAGALFTSLLFSLGKSLIGLYLGKAGVASTYGAAGSLAIVLVWVYYSAQIFFLGAELTLGYAETFGSRPCQHVGKEVKIVSTIDSVEPPAPPASPSGQLVSLE
jgi:membrane protein